jgi:hypothetical protein
MYGYRDLTSAQLYEQISRGTSPGDVFSVMTRRIAERSAIATLLAHGKCEIVYFGTNDVQLRRLSQGEETA